MTDTTPTSYNDLIEACLAAIHTNVWYSGASPAEQWHVSSFKHDSERTDDFGSPWQYEVQVWYPYPTKEKPLGRQVWTYEKHTMLADAERAHARIVSQIANGTYKYGNDD